MLVTLSNIPEESPLSLVVDLIEEVNVPITEIYQIVMNTETSAAKIWTNTKSALSLVRYILFYTDCMGLTSRGILLVSQSSPQDRNSSRM